MIQLIRTCTKCHDRKPIARDGKCLSCTTT
jgi:hypothetical protein